MSVINALIKLKKGKILLKIIQITKDIISALYRTNVHIKVRLIPKE